MPRQSRPTYHHGDLSRDAVSAAVRTLESRGLKGVSMRNLARQLGVSHASLYEHFTNRAALLAAVAAQGYRELASRMRRSGRGAAGALDSLTALATCYVRFAVERPTHLVVMNDPELTGGTESPDLGEAHGAVVALLTERVDRCQAAGSLPRGDPLELGLTLWVYAYGYVELYRTRRGFYHPPLGRSRAAGAVERHFRSTFSRLLRTLA